MLIDYEKKKLIDGLWVASLMVIILWIFKIAEITLDTDFRQLGIKPLSVKGLTGILTAPLVHKDFIHLFDNSVPLFLSIIGIFYFFRPRALESIFLIYICANALTWIIGRSDSYHIGASGIVYGYLSFLFFGGAFARNKNLLSLSLVIVFLYGSLVWGILPVKSEISWEGHYSGAFSGLVFALIFRKYALPPTMDEEIEDDETGENDTQSTFEGQ